jgi:ribosome maturation factor RimP
MNAMALRPRSQRVWDVAEPLAAQEGLELVDVEYHAERGGMVLRLFVDRAGGVTVDDLSRFSRELGDLLDVHGETAGGYTLEVSSPGVNRRLVRPAHFQRYVGRRIRVRTGVPLAERRNFLGTLLSATEDEIVVRVGDGEEVRIPLAAITRANYEHDFDAERRTGAAGRRRIDARPGRREA